MNSTRHHNLPSLLQGAQISKAEHMILEIQVWEKGQRVQEVASVPETTGEETIVQGREPTESV